MKKEDFKSIYLENRNAWRIWLKENHVSEKNIWLKIYKKQSQTPSVYYDEAVNEALCFGWIDSLIKKGKWIIEILKADNQHFIIFNYPFSIIH
jgi:uncharacterized protein YdeI (YjbR/CyaY-like superfamily)